MEATGGSQPPASLGGSLLVGERSFEIVGVMPASFWFPSRGFPDVVLPWIAAPKDVATQTLCRLPEGESTVSAAAVLSSSLVTYKGNRRTARIVTLREESRKRFWMGLAFLLGPSLLVIVSVCANVGALLTGNMLLNEKDLAIRAAMGAGPWRLAGEGAAEALVLSLVGGVFALLGAFGAVAILKRSALATNPGFLEALPPWTSAWPIVIAAIVITTFGSAIAPALYASKTDITATMAGRLRLPIQRRRGQYGAKDLMLVLQVAIAAGLVTWVSMVFQLVGEVGRLSPNVAAERVWIIDVTVPEKASTRREPLLSAALHGALSWPGIESAAFTDSIPTPAGPRSPALTWQARTSTGRSMTCSAGLIHVTPSYFQTVGVVPRGRPPSDSHQVLLNSLAVERCGNPNELRGGIGETGLLTVIGKVEDDLADGPVFPRRPVVYAPFAFRDSTRATLLVRATSVSSLDPIAFARALRHETPNLRLSDPVTLADWLHESLSGARVATSIFGSVAALALGLGLVGLHAALGQAVGTRTREIGIRLALGARTREVLVTTLGHHAIAALVGVLLGASVAVLATRSLGGPFATTSTDPQLWLFLVGVLCVSGVVSTLVPVLRTVRVDPAVVLRKEA